jgi:hypothetical protein
LSAIDEIQGSRAKFSSPLSRFLQARNACLKDCLQFTHRSGALVRSTE